MVRFRVRRVVKLITVIFVLWLVILLGRHIWDALLEEEYEIEIDGSPDPDKNIPESFLRSPEGSTTPVVIVEEHHEVLKYWFAASESGLVSKTGNVLLHIDGHEDLAVPVIPKEFPLFRLPRNIAEISSMMQRNDAFIVAAALTGLIDRYIWVWPTWDEPNHTDDHVIMDVQLGTTSSLFADSKVTEMGSKVTLCMCFSMGNMDGAPECRRVNTTDVNADGILIDEAECFLNISGRVEFVSEQKVSMLLQTGDWISSRDTVILDIDEDYYGCQSAGTGLQAAKVSATLTETLSDIFSQLFCARNTRHESQLDAFFHSLIELLIRLRTDIEPNRKMTKKQKYIALQRVMYTLLPDIYQGLIHGPLKSILCPNPDDPVIDLLLQGVIRNTANLNITQLVSLAETGLCLRYSPKTSGYDISESLQICNGRESPQSPLLLFHTPTPFEIHERTKNLKKMLKSQFLKPSLVTVCRSVRDGYTPRKFFPRIEADILKLLHEVFPEVHYASFYHDGDLLGGASGWHGRAFNFEESLVNRVLKKYSKEIQDLGFSNF